MILTLARGHYCPKEHQQHLELAANYPKINVAYTKVVTISTDDHHTSQEFRKSVGAQWRFLSDPERIVQKDLDIKEYSARPRPEGAGAGCPSAVSAEVGGGHRDLAGASPEGDRSGPSQVTSAGALPLAAFPGMTTVIALTCESVAPTRAMPIPETGGPLSFGSPSRLFPTER